MKMAPRLIALTLAVGTMCLISSGVETMTIAPDAPDSSQILQPQQVLPKKQVNDSETAMEFTSVMREMQKLADQAPPPKVRSSTQSSTSHFKSPGSTKKSGGRVIKIGESPKGLKKIEDGQTTTFTSASKGSSVSPSTKRVCRYCGGAGCPSCVADDGRNPYAGDMSSNPTYLAMGGKQKPQNVTDANGRIQDGQYWIIPPNAEPRKWTSLSGSSIDATLIKFSLTKAILRKANEQISLNPLIFADSDLAYMLKFAGTQKDKVANREAEVAAMNAKQSSNGLLIANWVWGQQGYRNASLTSRGMLSGRLEHYFNTNMMGNGFVTDGDAVFEGSPQSDTIEVFQYSVEYVNKMGLVMVQPGRVYVGYGRNSDRATLLEMDAPGKGTMDGSFTVKKSLQERMLGDPR